MNFVHPPCSVCGRRVYPMGDREGGDLCRQSDIAGIAVAVRRALEEVSVGNPAWAHLQNILDIAERHAKIPA